MADPTSYDVTAHPTDNSGDVTVNVAFVPGQGSYSQQLTGLDPEKDYTVTVTAKNDAGNATPVAPAGNPHPSPVAATDFHEGFTGSGFLAGRVIGKHTWKNWSTYASSGPVRVELVSGEGQRHAGDSGSAGAIADHDTTDFDISAIIFIAPNSGNQIIFGYIDDNNYASLVFSDTSFHFVDVVAGVSNSGTLHDPSSTFTSNTEHLVRLHRVGSLVTADCDGVTVASFTTGLGGTKVGFTLGQGDAGVISKVREFGDSSTITNTPNVFITDFSETFDDQFLRSDVDPLDSPYTPAFTSGEFRLSGDKLLAHSGHTNATAFITGDRDSVEQEITYQYYGSSSFSLYLHDTRAALYDHTSFPDVEFTRQETGSPGTTRWKVNIQNAQVATGTVSGTRFADTKIKMRYDANTGTLTCYVDGTQVDSRSLAATGHYTTYGFGMADTNGNPMQPTAQVTEYKVTGHGLPTVPATPPPALNASTSLMGVAGDSQVSLMWVAPTTGSFSDFTVTTYASDGTTILFQEAIGSTTPAYTKTGLTNGTDYIFSVTANATGGGYGPESAHTSVITPVAASMSPVAFTDTFNRADANPIGPPYLLYTDVHPGSGLPVVISSNKAMNVNHVGETNTSTAAVMLVPMPSGTHDLDMTLSLHFNDPPQNGTGLGFVSADSSTNVNFLLMDDTGIATVKAQSYVDDGTGNRGAGDHTLRLLRSGTTFTAYVDGTFYATWSDTSGYAVAYVQINLGNADLTQITSSVAPPVAASMFFVKDNFNRANAGTLGTPTVGPAWIEPNSNDLFNVSSNKAVASGPGGYGFAFNNYGSDHIDLTMEITPASAKYWFVDLLKLTFSSGAYLRVQRSNSGNVSINFESASGAETVLASQPEPSSGTTVYRFVATGGSTSTVTVYANGVQLVTANTSMADLTGQTYFGILGETGTTFDNVARTDQVMFYDDFHRADGALGSNYTYTGSGATQYAIVSNRIPAASATHDSAAYHDVGTNLMKVSVTYLTTGSENYYGAKIGGDTPGSDYFSFSWGDPGAGLYASWTDGGVNGQSLNLGSRPSSGQHVITASYDGTTCLGFVDGTQVFSRTMSSSFAPSTKGAFITYDPVEIDAFEIDHPLPA